MIRKIKLFEGDCFDPYYNLAIEQYLMETVEEDTCILYLWQNANTVVIGRNQNAWKECRTALLEEEGGRLARRLSGGGAVFHDLGNLNFTFLMPQADYDLDKQMQVIQNAVESCGIHTERSGRNDILAEGQKFSGNAFYKNGRQAYHHGTLLVDVDKEKLGRYLSPSKKKLQSKGVASVRSRVVNLKELNSELTVNKLKTALKTAFSQVYGTRADSILKSQLDQNVILQLQQRNGSWEWNYGREIPFTYEHEHRFEWGEVHIKAQVENGIIKQIKVYSDSMDWEVSPKLEENLIGSRFSEECLFNALEKI